MKLNAATFSLTHAKHGKIAVTFEGDVITVQFADQLKTKANKPAKWGGRPYKPCVSHAIRLAGEATALRKEPPPADASVAKEKPQIDAEKRRSGKSRLRIASH